YCLNLAVYAILLGPLGAHMAAAVSWVVAAANNYWWNRIWTFSHARGHFAYQGLRFFAVSAAALVANQIWLFIFLDGFGMDKLVAQPIPLAVCLPPTFGANSLCSSRGGGRRRPPPRRCCSRRGRSPPPRTPPRRCRPRRSGPTSRRS